MVHTSCMNGRSFVSCSDCQNEIIKHIGFTKNRKIQRTQEVNRVNNNMQKNMQ